MYLVIVMDGGGGQEGEEGLEQQQQPHQNRRQIMQTANFRSIKLDIQKTKYRKPL